MDSEVRDLVGTWAQADGDAIQRMLKDQLLGLIVTELHGKYREPTFRNRCFIISTPAAGVTVPIYTNATQQFVVYNPPNSGIGISLLKAWVGYVSGTMVAGHMCYAGSVAQAVPGTVTQALVQNSRLVVADSTKSGAGNRGMYFSPANPATALVAANYLRPMGNSQVAQTVAGTNAPWTQYDDIDGSIEVPPQGILVIAANVAAAVVATIGLLVEEVPVKGS